MIWLPNRMKQEMTSTSDADGSGVRCLNLFLLHMSFHFKFIFNYVYFIVRLSQQWYWPLLGQLLRAQPEADVSRQQAAGTSEPFVCRTERKCSLRGVTQPLGSGVACVAVTLLEGSRARLIHGVSEFVCGCVSECECNTHVTCVHHEPLLIISSRKILTVFEGLCHPRPPSPRTPPWNQGHSFCAFIPLLWKNNFNSCLCLPKKHAV